MRKEFHPTRSGFMGTVAGVVGGRVLSLTLSGHIDWFTFPPVPRIECSNLFTKMSETLIIWPLMWLDIEFRICGGNAAYFFNELPLTPTGDDDDER